MIPKIETRRDDNNTIQLTHRPNPRNHALSMFPPVAPSYPATLLPRPSRSTPFSSPSVPPSLRHPSPILSAQPDANLLALLPSAHHPRPRPTQPGTLLRRSYRARSLCVLLPRRSGRALIACAIPRHGQANIRHVANW